MPAMTSPSGEVLHIPSEGVAPMLALGWMVQSDDPAPVVEKPAVKATKRKRPAKAEEGR